MFEGMTKVDLVGYIGGLQTLIDNQGATGVRNPSLALGREFDRAWDRLKEILEEEEEKLNAAQDA